MSTFHRILIEPTRDGLPPLMLRSRHRLPRAAIEQIRADVQAALTTGKPLIIDGIFRVAQRVDGAWREIFPEPNPPASES